MPDERGNLTLRFVNIAEAGGKARAKKGLPDALTVKGSKWPQAGLLKRPKRNVCWRVLDAKFFGVPQQRRRLYLTARGKEFAKQLLRDVRIQTCRLQ